MISCYARSNNKTVPATSIWNLPGQLCGSNKTDAGDNGSSGQPGTVAPCCAQGDLCLDNLLCWTSNQAANPDKTGFYVAGCTSPDFAGSACSSHCATQGLPDIVYQGDKSAASGTWACCGFTLGSSNTCRNATSEKFQDPAPSVLLAAASSSSRVSTSSTPTSATSSSSASTTPPSASASSTLTSSGDASTSTAAATSSNVGNNLSPAAAAGIGVGVGLGVILAAALLVGFWLWHRRQRRQQQQEFSLGDTSTSWQGSPGAELDVVASRQESDGRVVSALSSAKTMLDEKSRPPTELSTAKEDRGPVEMGGESKHELRGS